MVFETRMGGNRRSFLMNFFSYLGFQIPALTDKGLVFVAERYVVQRRVWFIIIVIVYDYHWVLLMWSTGDGD